MNSPRVTGRVLCKNLLGRYCLINSIKNKFNLINGIEKKVWQDSKFQAIGKKRNWVARSKGRTTKNSQFIDGAGAGVAAKAQHSDARA